MINSYRSSGYSVGVENYKRQQAGTECRVVDRSAGASLAGAPVTIIQHPERSPIPTESIGVMAEIGKLIEKVVVSVNYIVSALKSFLKGLALFNEWFVKV